MSKLVALKILRSISQSVLRFSERGIMRCRLQECGIGGAAAIHTFTTFDELSILYELARRLPRNSFGLEIGSYLGASACFLAVGFKESGGHLFCIDTWQNETMPGGLRNTFAVFQQNTRPLAAYLTAIRKRSSEVQTADVKANLSLVFIDGDHSYESVKADCDVIAPWLVPEAVVAFHDCIEYRGVARMVGELLSEGNWKIRGQRQNLIWLQRTQSWLGSSS